MFDCVEECSIFDDKLRALCGVSRHTASSENYFIDSTYHNIISSKTSITKPILFRISKCRKYCI